MSSQNHEFVDMSAVNSANLNFRPEFSPEPNVRIMNPSKSQLARQKNKEDDEFVNKVLVSVTPGSRGEQCAGKPEFFYNEYRENAAAIVKKVKVAKALCNQCPIIEKCLEEALSQDDSQGIWGGMTEKERRRYANKLRRS